MKAYCSQTALDLREVRFEYNGRVIRLISGTECARDIGLRDEGEIHALPEVIFHTRFWTSWKITHCVTPRSFDWS